MDLDRSLFVPLSGRFIRRPPQAEKIMREAENEGIPLLLPPYDVDPLEFYNGVALWFYVRGALRDFASDNRSLRLFKGQNNYRDSCNMIAGTFSAGQRRVPVIFVSGTHTDRYVGTGVIENAREYYKHTFKRYPLTVKIRPAEPYEQPGLYLTDGPHRKILVLPSGLSEAAGEMGYLTGSV